MKEPNEFLMTGENIIFQTSIEKNSVMSISILGSSIISFFFSYIMINSFLTANDNPIKSTVFSLTIFLLSFSSAFYLFKLNYKYKNFVISNKRVFFLDSFILDKLDEINLNKIESIEIKKKSFIFDCSDLKINGTGNHSLSFLNIENGFEFKNKLNEQIEKNKTL